MHDRNDMPRRKLSSNWLNTHVTEQGVSLDLREGSKNLILIKLLFTHDFDNCDVTYKV